MDYPMYSHLEVLREPTGEHDTKTTRKRMETGIFLILILLYVIY